jgi:Flp pilus assembly protein TadG
MTDAKLRSVRGQALVEFALVLPMILILLVGILEFARAWNAHQVITDAAREGARIAVVADQPPIDSMTKKTMVRNAISRALSNAAIDPSKATVTVKGNGDGSGAQTTVNIQLPYHFTFFGPIIKMASGTGQPDVQLKTSYVMRNE